MSKTFYGSADCLPASGPPRDVLEVRLVSAPALTDFQWTLEPLAADPVDDDPLVDAILEAMTYRECYLAAVAALADETRKRHTLERRVRELLTGGRR